MWKTAFEKTPQIVVKYSCEKRKEICHMKRIQAACLIQTVGFYPKTDYPTQFEKDLVRKEYET